MDGQIIPLGLVREQAREQAQRAVASGASVNQSCPWPVGTAAAQVFLAEYAMHLAAFAETATREALMRASRRETGG